VLILMEHNVVSLAKALSLYLYKSSVSEFMSSYDSKLMSS